MCPLRDMCRSGLAWLGRETHNLAGVPSQNYGVIISARPQMRHLEVEGSNPSCGTSFHQSDFTMTGLLGTVSTVHHEDREMETGRRPRL